MISKFSKIISFLALSIISAPVFSHPGHTTAPHIHNSVEISLFAIAIAALLYSVAKK